MRSALLPATLLATLALAAPAAVAAEPIEGTWTFGSGEVVVRATGPGTFVGTVVKDTAFSGCTHRPGERMWEMTGSGTSYSGGHNWFNTADCSILVPKGRATWQITSTDARAYQLNFCSVPPDAGEPTPDNPRLSCDTLTRLRPPEPKVTPAVQREVLRDLPATRRCRSRRVFRIRIRQLAGVTYRTVQVKVGGRRAAVRRIGGRHVASVDLRRLPRGRFTVSIKVTTAEGQVVTGTRRYRTCAPKRRGGGGRL